MTWIFASLLVVCLAWIIFKALTNNPAISHQELDNMATYSELQDIIRNRPDHLISTGLSEYEQHKENPT